MAHIRIPVDQDFTYVSGGTSASQAGFSNIPIPNWAAEIRLEFDMANPTNCWMALLLPNGSTANQMSKRFRDAVVDVIENTRLPLCSSQDPLRARLTGIAYLEVAPTMAIKRFYTRGITLLSSGVVSPESRDHIDAVGAYNSAAGVTYIDIVGVTTGAAISNAFAAGSAYRLYARY